MKQTQATLRPFEYKGTSEYPDGIYNGHDIRLADMAAIWSVGRSPREAIEALCKARWSGKVEGDLEPLPGGDNRFTWGFRFVSDNGTGFKAAGIHVPGGVICTWWK